MFQLAFEQVGVGLVADGDEHALNGHFRLLVGFDIAQRDARNFFGSGIVDALDDRVPE